MRKKDRYDTADLDEDQFEPRSRRRVLKNLLHITSKREMDRLEGRKQVRALEDFAMAHDNKHCVAATDRWLICLTIRSHLYSAAGPT